MPIYAFRNVRLDIYESFTFQVTTPIISTCFGKPPKVGFVGIRQLHSKLESVELPILSQNRATDSHQWLDFD